MHKCYCCEGTETPGLGMDMNMDPSSDECLENYIVICREEVSPDCIVPVP